MGTHSAPCCAHYKDRRPEVYTAVKYNYSDMKTGSSGKPKIKDYQHTTAREKETVNKGEFRSGCGKSTSDDYFYQAT